ncbi:Endolytic murein transglycosylase [bacterium HR40]|nr:Endolytic murein transglycosylase [bacterium HR40]
MRRVLLILVLFGGLVGAASIGFALYLRDYLQAPGPLAARTLVILPRGAGLAEIGRILAEAGAIRRPFLFQLALRLSGRDRHLKAGEYELLPGMSPEEIITKLERGAVFLHRITVPEGLTVAQIYDLLEASDVLAGALPERPPEGSLLPETYFFPRGAARAQVVAAMREAMRKALAEAWEQRSPELPLASPEELLILASIVEKETPLAEEYPLVAAVFANRLRRGMPLQSDPTVIYALTRGAQPLGRALTRADLEIDDPYNTYRRGGLPPTPIANPGRAALFATARPADVDFLYFVADGSGGHAFSRSLGEHNRKVRSWRRLRDSAPGRGSLPQDPNASATAEQPAAPSTDGH